MLSAHKLPVSEERPITKRGLCKGQSAFDYHIYISGRLEVLTGEKSSRKGRLALASHTLITEPAEVYKGMEMGKTAKILTDILARIRGGHYHAIDIM
ncbi:hypothetical protein ACHWQZ_G017424 [Mnemiopsis leidyi]